MYQSSKRWFVDDVVEPLLEVNDGIFTLPTSPGMAIGSIMPS